MLESAIRRYQARAIEAAQIIEGLTALASSIDHAYDIFNFRMHPSSYVKKFYA
jgi:hypothetical protein